MKNMKCGSGVHYRIPRFTQNKCKIVQTYYINIYVCIKSTHHMRFSSDCK